MDNQKKFARAAKRYRQAGYHVIVQPSDNETPAFARVFEPDLIAAKGNENVVVKVKRDRSELAEDPSVSRLAEITNAQPGWRFDLIILEPETPFDEAAAHAAEPSVKQIDQLLAHAEKSASGGDLLASFIVAWAGLEAAMRFRSRADGLAGSQPTSPTVLIRMLYAAGLLSSDELRTLDKASRARNQIVHGFVPPKAKPAEVSYLVGLAKRLLDTGPNPGSV